MKDGLLWCSQLSFFCIFRYVLNACIHGIDSFHKQEGRTLICTRIENHFSSTELQLDTRFKACFGLKGK